MTKKTPAPQENSRKKPRIGQAETVGYRPSQDNEPISKINVGDASKKSFYDEYVKPLRPAKIVGQLPGLDVSAFKSNTIVDNARNHLGEHFLVQVEKKVDGGFGSGVHREVMPFDVFMEGARTGAHNGYLTTQYEDDEYVEESDEEDADPETVAAIEALEQNRESGSEADSIDFNNLKDDFEEEEEDFEPEKITELDGEALYLPEAIDRLSSFIHKPLLNSLREQKLPVRPSILSLMVPQQINLWVGSTKAENNPAYALSAEDPSKPDCGLGRGVPGPGTSSGLHHDHANNLYVLIQGRKRFTLFPPSDAPNLYTVGDINSIYHSGVIDYVPNEKSPNWLPVRSDGAVKDENASVEGVRGVVPPSFCRVPPVLLHIDELEEKDQKRAMEIRDKYYPNLSLARRITVELGPGEMLYLPAGWFHEVTSYGDDDDGIHIALNYWFYPTDGDSLEKPYLEDFWEKDYRRTEAVLNEYLKGGFEVE